MKKLLCAFMVLFLIVGCSFSDNTPIKQTDEFMSKYKNLDNVVLEDLDFNSELTGLLTENEKEEYKKVLKRQYSNMIYEIEEENINGDDATVTVKINVYDLYKIQKDSKQYSDENQEDFMKDGVYNNELYYDYMLNRMYTTDERVEYTIDIQLKKEDNNWKVKDLSTTTLEKIHGFYNYE